MSALPKATASPSSLPLYSSNISRRHEVDRIIKNSMTTPAVRSSLLQNSNEEECINCKQTGKVAQNSEGIPKPTFQQQNFPKLTSDFAQSIDANHQKAVRQSKQLKRRTLGSEIYTEDNVKKSSGDGFKTSRSIAQEQSLSKLNANYLEASLREEEEMFKRIEEKALILKQKEKKGRQILKKIRKDKEFTSQEQSNVTASLSAIAPMKSLKSKRNHNRGQSCDLPIIDSQLNSECLQSLQKVNSQLENDSINQSVIDKYCQTLHIMPQLSEMETKIDILKNQLDQQTQQLQRKNSIIMELEEKVHQLSTQLKYSALALQKQQKRACNLEQENVLLVKTHKDQLEQFLLNYQQQTSKKDKEIAQLASTISSQTMKLHHLQTNSAILQQQLVKNNLQIETYIKQGKTKNQEYQQAKRKLERDIALLTQEKRKLEQLYLKEIQALKVKAQQQIIEEKGRQKLRLIETTQKEHKLKILSDQLKLKQIEISNRLFEQQLSYKRQKEQLNRLNQALKDEANKLDSTITKLTIAKQESDSANKMLQLYLANAEEHIRKVQEKYHSANKQLTEKNLSYDFLWIQLKEVEDKNKLLQNRLQRQRQKGINEQEAEPHGSLLHSSENESPMKQGEKGLNHILSSSTLKEIKDLHGMIQQGSSNQHKRAPSEKEVKMPLSHRPSLNLPSQLLTDSKCSNQGEPQHEIVLEEVQSSSCNMLLKNDLSDAFSQENDQIFQMASNKNSNTSKMESSVGAFSEYSRAKSTQSALSHNQMEKEYQNKMKNSKLLAKLGKLKAKK